MVSRGTRLLIPTDGVNHSARTSPFPCPPLFFPPGSCPEGHALAGPDAADAVDWASWFPNRALPRPPHWMQGDDA